MVSFILDQKIWLLLFIVLIETVKFSDFMSFSSDPFRGGIAVF